MYMTREWRRNGAPPMKKSKRIIYSMKSGFFKIRVDLIKKIKEVIGR